ncbi:Oxygen-insensitive NADPH nitroreductase [hydrothermal vent metagenome]|uniref:Oxygen-insensitive NADPH nitroreductase n=1 Tax=hydrothermal vent metagenome TaxID=652676 RepID=A0A3B0UI03_9ZZZZ
MDLLLKHKTIRKFLEKEVPSELLENILTAGCRASTTGNMQVYSIIVTKNRAVKEKLMPLHFNQPVAKSAPLLLTFCADFNRFSKWCELRKAIPGYNNFLSFITASIDALLAAQNVCIAAEDKGLGICYLGTTTYNAKEIIEVLNLPKLVFPVTTVAIGWPGEDPLQTDRLPLKAVVHEERYKDYSKEDIDELYSYKENLPESLQFISENSKETLAQVFTDVRYKKSDNEFFSEKIVEVLKVQGFLS